MTTDTNHHAKVDARDLGHRLDHLDERLDLLIARSRRKEPVVPAPTPGRFSMEDFNEAEVYPSPNLWQMFEYYIVKGRRDLEDRLADLEERAGVPEKERGAFMDDVFYWGVLRSEAYVELGAAIGVELARHGDLTVADYGEIINTWLLKKGRTPVSEV